MYPHVWAYKVLFAVLVLTQNVLRRKDDEGAQEGRKLNKKIKYTTTLPSTQKMLFFVLKFRVYFLSCVFPVVRFFWKSKGYFFR